MLFIWCVNLAEHLVKKINNIFLRNGQNNWPKSQMPFIKPRQAQSLMNCRIYQIQVCGLSTCFGFKSNAGRFFAWTPKFFWLKLHKIYLSLFSLQRTHIIKRENWEWKIEFSKRATFSIFCQLKQVSNFCFLLLTFFIKSFKWWYFSHGIELILLFLFFSTIKFLDESSLSL